MRLSAPKGILSGLGWQFGALMTIILVFSMAGSAWMEYRDNTHVTNETLSTRIESIGQILADISIEPLLVYDLVSIDDHMRSAVAQKDIVYAILLGDKDNTISSHINSKSSLVSESSLDKDSNTIIDQLKNNSDVLSGTYAIQLDNKKIGTLLLGLDRRSYDKTAKDRLWDIITITIITGLLAGFAIYIIFSHRVLQPINRLKKAANRIADFELDRRIEIEGRNELSDLAVSFNDMTEHLAEAISARRQTMTELRQLNESLEDRIHERTLELQQLNNKVTHQAMHDPLTGLPNRTLIMERLKQAIRYANRNKGQVALFMLDLNRFKEVNDTLGHPIGDLLLQGVAERLPKALRETDTVGRLGGDEFVIILSESDLDQAQVVAEKIRSEFAPDFIIDGHSLSIDASIGVALYPMHGENPDTLLQRADVAMYVAKGKNDLHVAVYREAEDRHTLSRLLLITDLKDAISNDHLSLHFQPQINLASGRVCGVEALCRWQHIEKGFISPEIFIPMAEDSGLIKPLTDWVLKTAVQQQAQWLAAGHRLRMAINLSVGNLLDPQLTQRVSSLLKMHPVPPESLKLEITESIIMSDPDRVIETLLNPVLNDMHCAIDDFGTGYSSLNHLKRLPVNEIKIDKSFVIDMTNDEDDASIVRSIIQLAQSLGLKVVAEGVENKETARQLLALGCDTAQGYYYSKPIPAEQIPDTIKTIERLSLA